MKRSFLLGLAASIAASGAPPAFAGFPTVYGKINVSASQYDLDRKLWSIAGPCSTKLQYGDSTGTPANTFNDDVDIDAIF